MTQAAEHNAQANRLHIHLKTADLGRSVRYYTALFGRAPDVAKPDYAKWLLDDPRANVSLSTHAARAEGETIGALKEGVDHVGLQFADADAMRAADARLREADEASAEEAGSRCCYALSDKFWTKSPEGAVWELFHTTGDLDAYGSEPDREAIAAASTSCGCA